MSKWNDKSVENYDAKVRALLEEMKNSKDLTIHFGKSNSKTQMLDEGTSVGIAGTCGEECIGDCRNVCYAMTHMDGRLELTRKYHAMNTILRRRDRISYYEAFFAEAEKCGMNLRVNESGDFECPEDIGCLVMIAKKHPSVRVIGYTHRVALIPHVAEANKLENVRIHFSMGCKGVGKTIVESLGVPTTSIVDDIKDCNCPNQIAKRNGKVWNCSKCAELGCGCFSLRNIRFLAH